MDLWINFCKNGTNICMTFAIVLLSMNKFTCRVGESCFKWIFYVTLMCNSFANVLHCRFSKLQCMDDSWDNLNKPSPLGVKALSGLFILLGCGLIVGIILLFFEHAFYKYLLPQLRNKPREDFWRSRRVMFFSQVIYQTSGVKVESKKIIKKMKGKINLLLF